MATQTYVGDLTLRQVAARKGTTFHRHMTTADLISGLTKILPILATYFPPLAALLKILETLSKLYDTLVKLYYQLVKVLKILTKAITTAAGLSPFTGGPATGIAKTSGEVASEAGKAVQNVAKKAVDEATKKLIDPILDTPIKNYATGLPLPPVP